MEQVIKVRHNTTSVSDIHTFQMMKGEISDNYKTVCFVRAIGTNADYLSDIHNMDEVFWENMKAGRGYYFRLNSLPAVQSIEDTNFYTQCYTDWVGTDRKEMLTRVAVKNKTLAQILSEACLQMETLYKQNNKQATDSIVKNFIVKLLFWFDYVFENTGFLFDEKKEIKVVASNIVKKHEYLFFYFVSLVGGNVLLLQSKADIAAEEEKLGLSTKFVLGDFSDVVLPPYKWQENRSGQPEREHRESVTIQGSDLSEGSNRNGTAEQANPASQTMQEHNALNSNGRITVKLPERNRPGRHSAQNSQRNGAQPEGGEATQQNTSAQGNPRVIIPPRPGETSGGSQTSDVGRQVRITTPVHSAAPLPSGQETEKSFEELAMLASSVVLITVFDGQGERLGSGSGIMIGKEGYILTNNHVAAGGRFFSVRIEEDEKEYRTDEIIKYHSVLDLAIIRIQRKLDPIPVYRGSKPLVRGQKVVAIGSPLGLFNSVSNGIISGFRKIDDVDMIQFTAPTSRGSSGGAVLNMQGEVIGISTAGIDAGQNINLAMGYECINMFIRGFI